MSGAKATAVLVDLDRTLVDLQSHTDYAAAWQAIQPIVASGSNVQVPETDWDRPTQSCMSALIALAGTPQWQSASDEIALFERAAIPQSIAMPTLVEAQQVWADAPVAVITLLPPDVADEVLRFHGVRIPIIIGRQSELRPKPYGDGLREACSRLGVDPSNATMIGDASWDLAAAQDAGSAFIGVPFTAGSLPEGTPTASTLAEAVYAALS